MKAYVFQVKALNSQEWVKTYMSSALAKDLFEKQTNIRFPYLNIMFEGCRRIERNQSNATSGIFTLSYIS
jgi:hypothetical protein